MKTCKMQEAFFWETAPDEKVKCLLCTHECLLPEGKRGLCRVRENRKGRLYSTVYGQAAAVHTDPVEKKPLYHFHPGRPILSAGTFGCNLSCSFCQNYNLSQSGKLSVVSTDHSPENLVRMALRIEGNIGMAYTYNEPVVFYEYMIDTAGLVHAAGLKNAMISNGFISSEPLRKLLSVTDAFNIDLKAFSDAFYHKHTGGALRPVLNTLLAVVQAGRHLEITHLVIPGLNDDPDLFSQMVNWISRELGEDIPLHLSRYFPAFKLTQPPTPTETLHHFAHLAGEKLRYVYTGNDTTGEYASTRCPGCSNLLILRQGYQTSITGLTRTGECNRCGAKIPVILK